MTGNLLIAFGLTLFAGLATGIGSMIAFSAKRTNYRFLSVATGFSAGVMLYVSFVEIFPKGVAALAEQYGEQWAHWINAGSFFAGMFVIGLIDYLIPKSDNPHETHPEAEFAPLHDPQKIFPAPVPLAGLERPHILVMLTARPSVVSSARSGGTKKASLGSRLKHVWQGFNF